MAVALPRPLPFAAPLRLAVWLRRAAFAAAVAVPAAGYAVLGMETTLGRRILAPDTLARLAHADLVWHGGPSKLAALGFGSPPLPTILLLPAAAFRDGDQSLAAVAATGGLLAAIALVAVERTLARCAMPAAWRLPIVLALAVNPLFAYWAAGGVSIPAQLALLALALYALVSWAAEGRPRHLTGAGLAFGALALARYQLALWALVGALLVVSVLARRRARAEEVEGSVLAYAAPLVYALTVWTLFGALVLGHPFQWAATGAGSGPAATTGIVGRRLLDLAVGGFPLAFVTVPGLGILARLRRDPAAPWLAGLPLLGVAILSVGALASERQSWLELGHALPLALAALAAAGWAHRIGGRLRPLVAALALAGTVAGIFTGWLAMESYPVRAGEGELVRALRGQPATPGARLDPEAAMAAYVSAHVRGRATVLVDESAHPAPIVFANRPDAFLTRANAGNRRWREALDHPAGRVRWLLLDAGRPGGDLVARRWPSLAAGAPTPGFQVALRTRREVLVRVVPGAPADPAPRARR